MMDEMTGKADLSGMVIRVLYVNPENGWRVFKVQPDDKLQSKFGYQDITVTGEFTELSLGDHVDIEGEWNDSKYGKQIKMTRQKFETMYTKEGMYRFLSSGQIKGVKDALASSIVNKFGDQLPDIIEKEPEKLRKIKGMSQKRIDSLIEAWNEKAGLRRLMVFLQQANITNGIAVKIYKIWGDGSVEEIQKDPYIITQLSGVGFQTADVFALSLGIRKDSVERIMAGVYYALDIAAHNGHTFLPIDELTKEMANLLDVTPSRVESVVHENKRRLIITPVDDVDEAVFDRRNFNAENYGAKKMLKLMEGSVMRVPAITDVEGLTDEQITGLQNALTSKISIITGGPGTGKSHCIKKILDHLEFNGKKSSLAAPTGKAAKRMKETTGRDGMTLHRLLGLTPNSADEIIADVFLGDPLNSDFFVIDEYSMVDAWLNFKLFEKLPAKAHVLIVGDVDQLPSVGAGNVLRDMIDSGLFPVTRLTKIFRQAESSDIVRNAHKINRGLFFQIANENGMYHFATNVSETAAGWITHEVFQRLNKKFGIKYEDIQVLVPMYKGNCGVILLNEKLRNEFNPDLGQDNVQVGKQTFRVGDRVMQTKNNYDLITFNGDTGYITKVEGSTVSSKRITIRFDERDVEYTLEQMHDITLAYAITIHKSQGCEYPGVIIALLPEHYIMLQRNLLYTAVTRAKTACVLVGDEKSMNIAISNDKINKRYTSLKWFLKNVTLDDGDIEETIEEVSLEKKLKEKELEVDEIPF
jgi:exodeoxyribonuclease V alpha subunit